MKILFTVTCYTKGGFTGKGGHYYSLVTIVNELIKSGINCHIVTLGTSESDVIRKSQITNYFLRFNGINLWKTRTELDCLVASGNYNIIHAFDYSSYIICSRIKIKIILTKCGGQSPNTIYPIPPSLILFSKENLNYFQNNLNYKNTKLYLIPNRVSEFETSLFRGNSIKAKLNIQENDLVIMRIARISVDYKDGIIQTLRLAAFVREKFGRKVRAVIIGKKQCENTYDEIVNKLTEFDSVITDDEYTFNSKELLGISNVVVATGRGLIEACSLGKNIFVPINSQNGDFPVFLNEKTFEKLFFYNFSQRNTFKTNIDHTFSTLSSILHLKDSQFSRNVFINNFNVSKVVEKYINVYENSSFDEQFWNKYISEIKLIINNFNKLYLSKYL